MPSQPTYRIDLSYEDNYKQGPFFKDEIPKRKITRRENFLGFEVNSRLGIPAGPLLNANWVLTYAALGFDLPVYKTVRTHFAPSHPAPNCMILDLQEAIKEKEIGGQLKVAPNAGADWTGDISITNSFGMPSRDPKEWQADVEKAKAGMGEGQVLIVSVVGTPGEGVDLAEDYALGARMAVEAGAEIVEINLSCPNVISGEGSLFTDPNASSRISAKVKRAIGETPLLIKMGYISDPSRLTQVILANAPHIEGVASVNTLPFEVVAPDGSPALPGEGRLRSGVCGAAIKNCAMSQASRLIKIRQMGGYDFVVVGVGGAMSPQDIRDYFSLGVDAVMSATGAMWDPLLAYRFWKEGQEGA